MNLARLSINNLQVTFSFIFAHFRISKTSTTYIFMKILNCYENDHTRKWGWPSRRVPGLRAHAERPGTVPGAPHWARSIPHLRADQVFIPFSEVTKSSRELVKPVQSHNLRKRQNSAPHPRPPGPCSLHKPCSRSQMEHVLGYATFCVCHTCPRSHKFKMKGKKN